MLKGREYDLFLICFPRQRVGGRNIFDDKAASLRFAVAVAHKLAQFYRRRKIIAVRVLKCAKRAALLHKLINFKQNSLADFIRQRNKRQAADYITDFAETGFLVD